MATDPDGDVVDTLSAAIGSLSKNFNLFRGKVREVSKGVPAEAVFVLATGGPEPEAFESTTIEHYRSAIQCRIRSAKRTGFSSGQTLARAVRDALHHQPIAGYVDVKALEQEPIYVEEDDAGSHHWSVNLELLHEENR